MKLPDAELAVLEQLWKLHAATIRQVAAELYPGGSAAEYATVQKLLERLEAKGLVRRERVPPAHRFSPCVTRDDVVGEQLREIADRLCEGSLTPLLTQLITRARLSRRDRDRLRKLLDDSPGAGAR